MLLWREYLKTWLRKKSDILETDLVYLAHGGFWLTLGQVVSAVAAFLLSVVLANALTPDAYGNYKYVLAVLGVLSLTTLPGLQTAVTRATARGQEGSLWPAFKKQIKGGLVGGGLSLLLAIYYAAQHDLTLAGGFLIAGLCLPFFDPLTIYEAHCQGKKHFPLAVRWGLVIKIGATVLIMLTAWLSRQALWLIVAYLLSYLFLRLLAFKKTLKKLPPNDQIDPQTLSYGWHLSWQSVANTIAGQLDKILLFHYLGAAELAVYAVALAPTEQIKSFFKNFGVLALPKLSQQPIEQIKKSWWKKIFYLELLMLAAVSAYCLIAPWLFTWFFPRYLAGVCYSQILAISLLAMPISILNSTLLQAKAKVKALYYANVLGPLLQIILLAVGLYLAGLTGVILARLIYRFLFAAALSYGLSKIQE